MVTPIDLGFILSVGDLAMKITALLGIVESLDKKINRLVEAELESGLRALYDAIEAKIPEPILRNAWHHLNKAISLEKGYRLAICYLGLAFCQYHLREFELYSKTLAKIPLIEEGFDFKNLSKITAIGAATAGVIVFTLPIVMIVVVVGSVFLALSKKKGKEYLDKIGSKLNILRESVKNKKLEFLKNAVNEYLVSL